MRRHLTPTFARSIALSASIAALTVALLAGSASAQPTQEATCARRSLPEGGSSLSVRTPGAERGSLFIGFEALGLGWPELAVAHGIALEESLRRTLERPLADAAGVLRVERLPGSLLIEVQANARALEALVDPLVRALLEAGPTLVAPAPTPRASAATSIDLGGTRVTLGPDRWSPAARAIVLAVSGAPATPVGENLEELHTALLRRSGAAIGLAADLDAEAVARIATTTVALLPDAEVPATPASSPLAVPLARRITTAFGEDPIGGIGVVGSACRSDAPDAPALLVLEEYVRATLNAFGPAPTELAAPPGARAASASFVPGWGRPGRVAVWLEAPADQLGARSQEWVELLGTFAQPEVTIDDETFAVARDSAVRRLATTEGPLDLLRREVRLALHGAPNGWRETVTAEVNALSPAGLSAAAMRHLADNRLVWGASTTEGAAEALATIAEVVEGPAPSDVYVVAGATVEAPTSVRDDERALAASSRLLESVGGREAWRDLRALRISAEVVRGDRRVEVLQELDLAAPRARLRVEGGGTTILDGDRARWTGPGGAAELDSGPLRRASREGIARILHEIALRDGTFEIASPTADRLVLRERESELSLTLLLDASGRATALLRGADAEPALRFEDWTEKGSVWLPSRIVDVAEGTTFTIRTVEPLRRFDPAWVR